MSRNPHIESLVFSARTLEAGKLIHLRFHDIAHVQTADDRFDYVGGNVLQVLPCRYSSLRLLEPDAVLEARLRAVG